MELRGYRRVNKPICGLFSSHYFIRCGGESQFTAAPRPARRRPLRRTSRPESRVCVDCDKDIASLTYCCRSSSGMLLSS